MKRKKMTNSMVVTSTVFAMTFVINASNVNGQVTSTIVKEYENSIGMKLRLIPAGNFIMGINADEPSFYSYENSTEVTMTSPYYMQTTEVTQKQWNDVMGQIRPLHQYKGDEYPANNINWFDAAYFTNVLSASEGLSECYALINCSLSMGYMTCDSAIINAGCTGYRLPTDAQWEYAARAGTTTMFGNPYSTNHAYDNRIGSDFNANLYDMGWYSYNNIMKNVPAKIGATPIPAYPAGIKPIARKQANNWGLYDMHGNVEEWCQDWWESEENFVGPLIDPQGPVNGTMRATRGGTYISAAHWTRSSFRNSNFPNSTNVGYVGNTGFRVVLPENF